MQRASTSTDRTCGEVERKKDREPDPDGEAQQPVAMPQIQKRGPGQPVDDAAIQHNAPPVLQV
jgi:hypothetical protein